MNRTFCTLITLAASVCVAPIQALAKDSQVIPTTMTSAAECAGATHLCYVHGRVADLATQGIVPLRQFLLRTRMIYQLDLIETVAWLDQRRALLAACEERSARTDPVAAAR
jgi:hypothetical protein